MASPVGASSQPAPQYPVSSSSSAPNVSTAAIMSVDDLKINIDELVTENERGSLTAIVKDIQINELILTFCALQPTLTSTEYDSLKALIETSVIDDAIKGHVLLNLAQLEAHTTDVAKENTEPDFDVFFVHFRSMEKIMQELHRINFSINTQMSVKSREAKKDFQAQQANYDKRIWQTARALESALKNKLAYLTMIKQQLATAHKIAIVESSGSITPATATSETRATPLLPDASWHLLQSIAQGIMSPDDETNADLPS